MHALLIWVSLVLAAPEPAIELPNAPGVAPRTKKDADPALTVHLTRNGEVLVDPTDITTGDKRLQESLKLKPGAKRTTLDDLGTHLQLAAMWYLRRQQKNGASEVELFRYRLCPLFVTIRADRRAPWRQVEWIMTICAERKYYKTRLAVNGTEGETTLDVFLPKYDPRKPEAQAHPIIVGVSLEGSKPKPTEWGPEEARRQVLMPTGLKASFGGREVTRLESIQQWVRDGRKAVERTPEAVVVGEIRASSKTEVQPVVTLVRWFRAAGYEHVHVWGAGRVPSPELRRMKTLPYPVKDVVPAAAHGTAGKRKVDVELEEEIVEPK